MRRILPVLIATMVVTQLSVRAANADTVVLAPHVLMPDGTIASGKAIVVNDEGVIARVIDADALPRDVEVVRYDRGVLSPGLIDVHSYVGVSGQNVERANAIDPSVRVIDGFDATSDDLDRAMRSGVTAALLAPAPVNVVPGRMATVSTHVGDDGQVTVFKDNAGVSVVLASSTFSPDRAPSSRAGALSLLRDAFGRSGEGGARLISEDSRIFVTCEAGQDVLNALAFFTDRDIEPIFIHSRDLSDVAARLGERKATVVVGPYAFIHDQKTLEGALDVVDAGGRVVFSGQTGTSNPDAVRVTASLAVRNGLAPADARRAMTSDAAEVAGAADRIGSIQPGRRADLVLFSGDPLRLDARVVEVWINGERTWSASSHNYDDKKVIGATHEEDS